MTEEYFVETKKLIATFKKELKEYENRRQKAIKEINEVITSKDLPLNHLLTICELLKNGLPIE